MRLYNNTDYLYIVRVNDLFKLGKSVLPEQRINLIQTDNPEKLTVVLVENVLDGDELEADLHSALRNQTNLHKKGEWYRWDQTIINQLIETIKTWASAC